MTGTKDHAICVTATESHTRRSILETPYVAVTLGWFLVAMLVRPIHPGDDWAFFTQIANMILDGKGLYIYTVREYSATSPWAFSYPPLAALVLVPFQAFSRALDLPAAFQSQLVSIPYLMGDVACAGLIVRLVRSYRSLPDEMAAGIFGAALLSPLFLYSTAWHGHQESFMMALVLAGVLALKATKWATAGLWFALALSMKHTALVFVVPAGIIVGVGYGWKFAAKFWGVSIGGFVVSLLPWLIADPSNTIYALKTFPAQMPVAAQSSWALMGSWVMSPQFDIVKPHINTVIALIWLGYSAWMCRRTKVTFDSSGCLGILAGCALITIALQKAGSLHYCLPGLVMLGVWDLSRSPKAFPWVSVLVTGILSNIAFAHLMPGDLPFDASTALAQLGVIGGALVFIHNMTAAPLPAGTEVAP